jgi:hypothetical protein
MDDTPNAPDRDDAITERTVSMDSRPAEPEVGAGRAINAAFSRNRTTPAAGGGGIGGDAQASDDDGQQEDFQGAGYPTEDMDDVDPRDEDDATEDDDGYRDEDEDEDDVEEEDDDGYRVNEDAEGLETGDGMLEELMVPPGGDALGGDRNTDPNLNGGHGIRMNAPEEGPMPIEDEPTDLSIIGHGHEGKAAWNRERIAMLQGMENDERDTRDATSEAVGLGGAAVAGVAEGWEGGIASPTLDQGDDAFEDELSEEEEVLGDMAIEDMADDILDDDSIRDPNNMPFLPEHRDLPDDNLSLEEQLIATPGEDILSSGAEIGVNEELEAEDLNQTDSITRTYEDTREFMDDAMEGNERRDGVEDR